MNMQGGLTTAFSPPVATALILIVAVVGAIDLILDGNLSDDFAVYAGIVGGSSGLLAIGRGLDKGQGAKP